MASIDHDIAWCSSTFDYWVNADCYCLNDYAMEEVGVGVFFDVSLS